MKLKIIMFIALTCVLCSDLIAGPIIIMQGGGRNQRFDFVERSDRRIVCRGSGSLICPVSFEQFFEKGVNYQVTDVIDFVTKQIASGERSGSAMYENAFKINWESLEDGFKIEADVEKLVQSDHE